METNQVTEIIRQELMLFGPEWWQWRKREVIGFRIYFEFGIYFIYVKVFFRLNLI